MPRTATTKKENGLEFEVMLDDGAICPEFAHGADAGADLRSPINITIPPRGHIVIDTGVHIAIPEGYCGILKSKSGLNVVFDLTGEGVIDSGYTGSIKCKLYNNGGGVYHFEKGDKIIQILFIKCWHPVFKVVEKFSQTTERGNNGFGSTGK